MNYLHSRTLQILYFNRIFCWSFYSNIKNYTWGSDALDEPPCCEIDGSIVNVGNALNKIMAVFILNRNQLLEY